ncbi:MAG: hypothetical protein M5U35_06730 [Roseovarius sp.]|nr:hypothetical protein [Roseovarius sp.]
MAQRVSGRHRLFREQRFEQVEDFPPADVGYWTITQHRADISFVDCQRPTPARAFLEKWRPGVVPLPPYLVIGRGMRRADRRQPGKSLTLDDHFQFARGLAVGEAASKHLGREAFPCEPPGHQESSRAAASVVSG